MLDFIASRERLSGDKFSVSCSALVRKVGELKCTKEESGA
jgi:hypothetical protein